MCTYCTGAIVTDEMQKAFESTVRLNEASKMETFTKSMLKVISCPRSYLHPENLDFLWRYVHGGVLLAHSLCFPLKILWSKMEVKYDNNEWLAEELMKEEIKKFIRDESFDDSNNQEVLEKLRAWLVAGLGHSRVIKDPAENRLFTLKAARRLDWRRKNRL